MRIPEFLFRPESSQELAQLLDGASPKSVLWTGAAKEGDTTGVLEAVKGAPRYAEIPDGTKTVVLAATLANPPLLPSGWALLMSTTEALSPDPHGLEKGGGQPSAPKAKASVAGAPALAASAYATELAWNGADGRLQALLSEEVVERCGRLRQLLVKLRLRDSRGCLYGPEYSIAVTKKPPAKQVWGSPLFCDALGQLACRDAGAASHLTLSLRNRICT